MPDFHPIENRLGLKKDNNPPSSNYSSANSDIRKSVLSLESLAAKKGQNRSNGETLQEWFNRLGFQEDKEFYRLYEEVRYGNKEVPQEKVSWFKDSVDRLEEKMEKGISEN